MGPDDLPVECQWNSDSWYLIRDDYPYLDVLTRGRFAQPVNPKIGKLQRLSDDTEGEGNQWQRWDFEAQLAKDRRLGEISLALKVPEDCELRCYIIPTQLLTYRDVIIVAEDIESELGVAAAWDVMSERPDRSWSRRKDGGRPVMSSELIDLVDEELRAASSIRRDPFTELGPHSKRGVPLTENAIVSHWAARRYSQLRESGAIVANALRSLRSKAGRNNPEKLQIRLSDEIKQLTAIERRLTDLRSALIRLTDDLELTTVIYPGPLFQRDHRLRQLLRAFAPLFSEALSEVESSRSHYPPVYLNRLWELWGAVWLVKELRRLGFSGTSTAEAGGALRSCSWRLRRNEIRLELDFEPTPALVDYSKLPAVHDRNIPALEWAAQNQGIDAERPFLGLDLHCSPDYLLRISTPSGKFLIVGDACLASPKHHGTKQDKRDAKPYKVEDYRRTIGWAVSGQIVRCHPIGGFVIFPPTSEDWLAFERLPGASDCTLFCPNPRGDEEASRRLKHLLLMVAPEIGEHDEAIYDAAG